MPSESDANNRGPNLPAELERDYLAFKSELDRLVQSGVACAALQNLLASPKTLDHLIQFALLLYRQSRQLALVARGDLPRLFTRHILDSLNPVSIFPRHPASILDIGSGSGLPGIPLALVWPYSRVILLESREKKAGFLERAVRELELRNVRVVCARLEDAASSWSEPLVEAVVIRAVGRLPDLLREASRVAAPCAIWVYFLGTAERAGPLIDSIDAGAFGPTAGCGALGGWLLTGRFAPSGR